MKKIELSGKRIKVLVNGDLSLTVLRRNGPRLWETSKLQVPVCSVRTGGAEPLSLPLASAKAISVSPFSDGKYQGSLVRLGGLGNTDVVLELVLALNAEEDELLIQVAQSGGRDKVTGIEHLYRFEKPVSQGGYLVLPHGSGYLIPADCPDELPGCGHKGGIIGARWTLPMFGMVCGREALLAIVETWWDCDAQADHMPGVQSALDFNWLASLGTLAYPRRFIVKFAEGMDYAGMAKFYRDYARDRALLRTLKEKAETTPVLRRYVENILLRWPAWNTDDGPAVLADISRLKKMGFGINFFFPKWSSAGYSPQQNTATTTNCLWQAYLHPAPVPGGWQSLVEYADKVHKSGCVIQAFICHRTQDPDGPEYDESRWPVNAKGLRIKGDLSTHDALARLIRVLDNIEERKLKMDVLYFDGYSAYTPVPEDFSTAHPVSRRQVFEAQNDCFAETRRRGIVSGAEVARFWCLSDCDYFFFTDWSSDRLTNVPTRGAGAPVGEPVPLFQLVFHDCYIAGFSGGGYALYSAGYDWWPDRTPRLYELMFTAAPAHNWLPDGHVPLLNRQNIKTEKRWEWLKQWSAYYRTIAAEEMVSHKFLSRDRTRQSVEFSNGVSAEFDMMRNRFRLIGVPGFKEQWMTPPEEL